MKKRQQKQVVVVLGLVRGLDGRCLVTRRYQPNLPSAHQKWQIPGGELEFGEEPRETLVREITEEVGLTAKIIDLLPYIGTSLWQNASVESHVILLCYLLEFTTGVVLLNKEASEFAWVYPDEMKEEDTLPHTMTFLTLAAKVANK